MSNGLRGLLVVACATLSGAGYYWYLGAEPFPPDSIRLVPAVWLAGAATGVVLAARGLKSDRGRAPSALALVLGVPSAILAIIFTMAALMGD